MLKQLNYSTKHSSNELNVMAFSVVSSVTAGQKSPKLAC